MVHARLGKEGAGVCCCFVCSPGGPQLLPKVVDHPIFLVESEGCRILLSISTKSSDALLRENAKKGKTNISMIPPTLLVARVFVFDVDCKVEGERTKNEQINQLLVFSRTIVR